MNEPLVTVARRSSSPMISIEAGSRPISSCASRRAPSTGDSPGSTRPPGKLTSPWWVRSPQVRRVSTTCAPGPRRRRARPAADGRRAAPARPTAGRGAARAREGSGRPPSDRRARRRRSPESARGESTPGDRPGAGLDRGRPGRAERRERRPHVGHGGAPLLGRQVGPRCGAAGPGVERPRDALLAAPARGHRPGGARRLLPRRRPAG